jgi:hypothetical protein
MIKVVLAIAITAAVPPGAFAAECGDADCNGQSNTTDALLILRASVGQNVTVHCDSSCGAALTASSTPRAAGVCGDVDCNGSRAVSDALLVLRHAVGQPVSVYCDDQCAAPCGIFDKCVFVTSETHDGLLSGPEGGHDLCNELATAAGLPGDYRALLAGGIDELAGSGPYVLVNGTQVGTSLGDIFENSLDAPINLTETGATVDDEECLVWTGLAVDGGHSGFSCNFWSDNEADSGSFGYCTATDGWTDASTLPCTNELHLYCFQR